MADADTIVHEVEAFYRTYIDGFNREDTNAFLGSFAYPHALLTGERGMLVTATAADQKRFLQQTMTSLHERSWGRSDLDHLQVRPFADAFAVIVADVTRSKKDESILEKLRACYMVGRGEGTWKILAFMEIKPPFSRPSTGAESYIPEAETLVREVEAFYRAFIDGFNREDTDMYLRSFCYPNALLSGEQGMTINTKESAQQRFYQEVMTAIQGRGWERTGVDRLQVWPLADTMAMLVANMTRYKRDSSVLERGRYCYTVRKDGGAWKILTLTEVKPPFTGPGS